MLNLPDIRSWRQDTEPETAEKEVRWLQELISDADKAIEAQQRIMTHDGQLEAHKLSLQSLETSQRQLLGQLAAIMERRDTEVMDFALDGERYRKHRSNAMALSSFLSAMQRLYERVGQAMAIPNPSQVIPPDLRNLFQLEVAGFFPSSFGVRFAAPTRSDLAGFSLTATALDATFDLVNSENHIDQLSRVGPWAMRKYSHLVKTLVHAEATPKVRWWTPAGSERTWIIDDNQLLTLNNRLARIHFVAPKTKESYGVLTGASLRRHRFEFSGDEGVITGTAPQELSGKITLHFGQPCRITYSETRYIDETTEQEKCARVLLDISA